MIAQRVQKTIPTNIPMGKAAEAKMTSLALAKPDFLPVKLAMKAIRKKPHWKEKGVSKVVVETFKKKIDAERLRLIQDSSD